VHDLCGGKWEEWWIYRNVEGDDFDFKVPFLNFPKQTNVRDEKYRMQGLRITKLSATAEPLNNEVQLQ
jgi:hypothetical protein